jgi:hypothetical protein
MLASIGKSTAYTVARALLSARIQKVELRVQLGLPLDNSAGLSTDEFFSFERKRSLEQRLQVISTEAEPSENEVRDYASREREVSAASQIKRPISAKLVRQNTNTLDLSALN